MIGKNNLKTNMIFIFYNTFHKYFGFLHPAIIFRFFYNFDNISMRQNVIELLKNAINLRSIIHHGSLSNKC